MWKLSVFYCFLVVCGLLLKQQQAMTLDQIIAAAAEDAGQLEFMRTEGQEEEVLLELDMVVTTKQLEEWHRGEEEEEEKESSNKMKGKKKGKKGKKRKHRGTRNAWKNTKYRWTNNIVPFMYNDGEFDSKDKDTIQSAMDEWMEHTCVQFRPARQADDNMILFVNGGGCRSNVGMIGSNQTVILAKGCRYKGVVAHELGHALGFQHEQTRPDRDQFVDIHFENIPDDKEFNFRKYSWDVINDYDVDYDYKSIMHYGKTAFSQNGKPTIETHDKEFMDVIGNRAALSFGDVKLANRMMDCTPNNCGLTDNDCPGEGYVSKNCECVCPGPTLTNSIVKCEPSNKPTPKPATTRPTTPENLYNGPCSDVSSLCSAFKRKGYCETSQNFMQMYCRRTCQMCNGNQAQTNPCRDDHQNCGRWQGQGYCTLGRYWAYMSSNCKKSCGLC